MFDLDDAAERTDRSPGWLTPTAAAIAGFTIAVLSLLSNGAWLVAIQAFVTRDGTSGFSTVVIASGTAQAVLALIALALASRAVGSPGPAARHLGGAALIVGGLGLVVAALTILAGVAPS